MVNEIDSLRSSYTKISRKFEMSSEELNDMAERYEEMRLKYERIAKWKSKLDLEKLHLTFPDETTISSS